jgi:hypothetical protein
LESQGFVLGSRITITALIKAFHLSQAGGSMDITYRRPLVNTSDQSSFWEK